MAAIALPPPLPLSSHRPRHLHSTSRIFTVNNTKYSIAIAAINASSSIIAVEGKAIHVLEGESQTKNRPWFTVADITKLCNEGRLKEALVAMDQQGSPLDSHIYASVLQACANMKALGEGKQLHARIVTSGFYQNVSLRTKLVSMYAVCGTVVDARLVFDEIPKHYLSLWNEMIRGHVSNGFCEEALALYYQMQRTGLKPDNFTFSSMPMACAGLSAPRQGEEIHCHIIKGGFESNLFVGNALVGMYARYARVEDAREVFDKMNERSVVSWSAMIAGYAQNLQADEAMKLFRRMIQDGVKPNLVTSVSILPACAHLAALQQGKEIHNYIIKNRFQCNAFVWSSLVAMYTQCGRIDVARRIFDQIPRKSVFLWNAMIAGYAQSGHADTSLQLFSQMPRHNVKPNSITVVSVLPACAHLAALEKGKEIHGYIIRSGFESYVAVGNALVDMYSKCGSIEFACNVFDKISQRNVVSWTAMIAGYGMNGHGDDAVTVFNQMRQAGLTPNHITFVAVLSACSRAGLIVEGWQYFNCMTRDYHITPRVEHYACMVDLLSRAGHLNEAETFIREMPLEPNACVWGALLGACRIHCNIQLGERVAEQLLELEPENDGNYVLLSNIYAAAGRWDDAAKVRTMMKDRGLKKRPGCSWIVVKNKVHAFLVGDRSNPQSEKIYAMLESLDDQIKEAGYVPDKNFVLHDVEEKEKENFLSAHSEKLAIAFGLINTCPGTPIRITKNLRVCGDCHTASKFISKIVRREIIVRDAKLFHCFKDGSCSCRDYW